MIDTLIPIPHAEAGIENQTQLSVNAFTALPVTAEHADPSLENKTSTLQVSAEATLHFSGMEVDPVEVSLSDTTTSAAGEVESTSLHWRVGANGGGELPEAQVRTTLPAEAFKIDEEGKLYVPATSLDLLNTGGYELSMSNSSGYITVRELNGLKFVTSTHRRNDRGELFPEIPAENRLKARNMPLSFGGAGLPEMLSTQLSGNDKPEQVGVKILQDFGYMFDFENDRRTIPTPNTVEILSERAGAPIELVADTDEAGGIPIRRYLESFARGKYPVGTADIGIYAHDVRSNDHIAGVLVLGSEGLAMLAPIAEKVLESIDNLSSQDVDRAVSFFDVFTARVSQIIEQPSSQYFQDKFEDKRYNNQNAAAELVSICEQAEATAASFGVELKASDLKGLLHDHLKGIAGKLDLGEDFSAFLEILDSIDFEPKEVAAIPAPKEPVSRRG